VLCSLATPKAPAGPSISLRFEIEIRLQRSGRTLMPSIDDPIYPANPV